MEIVIDIETVPREIPESVKTWKLEKLKEGYKTESVIQDKYIEFCESAHFLPGLSRPVCIGMKNLKDKETVLFVSDDEKALATDFVKYIDEVTAQGLTVKEPIKLVGYNIRGFDWPMLELSIAKTGNGTHRKFQKYDFIDMMTDLDAYGSNRLPLSYWLEVYGIEAKTGEGSQVEANWNLDVEEYKATGKYGTRVSSYCAADVEKEARLYELRTLCRSL